MTTPTSDSEYLRDAIAQREHDLALARVEADRDRELARLANQRASERRTWWGYFCAGLLVLAIIGTITGALIWNTNRSKQERERQFEKQAETAKACIAAGDIWVNGNCLITRK